MLSIGSHRFRLARRFSIAHERYEQHHNRCWCELDSKSTGQQQDDNYKRICLMHFFTLLRDKKEPLDHRPLASRETRGSEPHVNRS